MKNIIFILAVLMISCSSQKSTSEKKEVNYIPYYLKVYEADSLYITQNYQRSFEILDSLFKEYEPLNFGIYSEYETYIKLCYLNNVDTNYKKLTQNLVTKYGYRKDNFQQDSLLSLVYKKAKVSDENYEKYRKTYINSLDLALRDTLIKIYERDQFVRKNYKIGGKVDLNKIDLYNQQKLIDILNTKGFPSVYITGTKELEKGKYDPIDITEVWIHMMDYGIDEKQYILDKLFEGVKAGKCNPAIYSLAMDRDFLTGKENLGNYMYAMSQVTENLKDAEKSKLNLNRKEIGLPSIQFEYFKFKHYFNY